MLAKISPIFVLIPLKSHKLVATKTEYGLLAPVSIHLYVRAFVPRFVRFRVNPLPHVLASSEYEFPIPSDSYDIVLSGGVIEHVRKVWVWIREVARVCKIGGLVITVAPASWPYHVAPIDCWRLIQKR